MNVLVDTNMLIRVHDVRNVASVVATEALTCVRAQGYVPCAVDQSLYEFWVVATRPVARNGLGESPLMATATLRRVEATVLRLPDRTGLYEEWRRLVTTFGVAGKPAHNARLVAAMHLHQVTTLVTFNDSDF